MEYVTSIVFISGMHLGMAMMPGPNTFAICFTASTASRRAGLRVAAGVIAATGLWVGLALLGTGLVIARNDAILLVLRAAAALYLMGVGLRMLAVPPARQPAHVQGKPFFTGFLTALSNPVAIPFWLGTFLAALPATAPRPVYAGIFCVIILQSAIWYSLLALVFSSALRGQGFGTARFLRCMAGAAMIGIGLNTLPVG